MIIRMKPSVYRMLLTLVFIVGDCSSFLVGHSRRFEDSASPVRIRQLSRSRQRQLILNRLLSAREAKPSNDGAWTERRTRQSKEKGNAFSQETLGQCHLDYSLRMDCGYFGINAEQCHQRECCWNETIRPDVPWCYHSKLTIKSVCLLEKTERQECGWYGIKRRMCLALDCCWQPTSDNSVPWCFQPLHSPSYPGQCGIPLHPPSVSSRIVGGVEAEPHSWPWVVSLQIDGGHFCAGALINSQWILSAAHCKRGFTWGNKREVVLGVHDLKAREETKFRIDIDALFPHPSFGKSRGVDNDVMLIRLAEPVPLTDAIIPVCLPEQGQELDPGKHCYTMGWGDLSAKGLSPERLQQVMVPIINSSICRDSDWYGASVDETMMCAGYEEGGRDACQGDSGGPLVCYIDDKWTLFGVVSWGEGCGKERKPGVYSKMSAFVQWIEATTSNNHV